MDVALKYCKILVTRSVDTSLKIGVFVLDINTRMLGSNVTTEAYPLTCLRWAVISTIEPQFKV